MVSGGKLVGIFTLVFEPRYTLWIGHRDHCAITLRPENIWMENGSPIFIYTDSSTRQCKCSERGNNGSFERFLGTEIRG